MKLSPLKQDALAQKAMQQELGQKVNILLVDDHPANLDALEETLAELGENLIRAESGKAALKQLLNKDFAVILMDVQMPVMDGFETTTLIKKRKKSAKCPIIFLTAYDRDNPKMLKGYETGAVDYIIKPYESQIMRSKVKVFVDLYRMREEIIAQKEKEAEQLREALESHAQLTGWQESSGTATVYGVGPLQQRAARAFARFEKDYASLLDEYLEALAFSEKPPSQKVGMIAEAMGQLGAGPRDVVQLHINCVNVKTKDTNPKRTRAYALEGRLLALEVMGYLVDFYRTQGPLRLKEKEDE